MSRYTEIENITIKVDAPIMDMTSSKEPMVLDKEEDKYV